MEGHDLAVSAMSSRGDKAAMNISWTTWNLLAAIFLALLYLFVFHMTKRWETERRHSRSRPPGVGRRVEGFP